MITFTDKFPLTHDNYHSLQANNAYMSNSQYRDFRVCEAMAMAKISGEYSSIESKALIAGKLLHSWNDGTIEEFKASTPALYKKAGGLYSEYQDIMDMIDVLRQDELVMFVLQGRKEVILTAEMFGCYWKSMLDVYNPEKRRFGELKSTRSIRELVWDPEEGGKVSFLEMYHYPRQHAVYAEMERLVSGRDPGDWYEGIMVAVSKEEPPDKEVISLKDPGRVEAELKAIEINMPRILSVKRHLAEPKRCERCAYCRGTKKLDRIIHYTELDK